MLHPGLSVNCYGQGKRKWFYSLAGVEGFDEGLYFERSCELARVETQSNRANTPIRALAWTVTIESLCHRAGLRGKPNSVFYVHFCYGDRFHTFR